MTETAISATPSVSEVATPSSTGPAAGSNGTASVPSNANSTNGAQAAPGTESFTSVDPSKLPPELKSAYDNMLRDYKNKTTSIAEQRKSFESSAKKAELFDQISSDPAFVDYWNGLNSKQKAQAVSDVSQNSNLKISPEEFAKAFESPENFLSLVDKVAERKMAGLQRKVQETESELIVTKASDFLKDFKSRPEYKDFDKYDKNGFITYQIQVNPPERADPRLWENALKRAYQNAERVYGEIYEDGRKTALARIQEKADLSTESPSNASAQIYPGGDPKKLTARDAVALAKKGIRVPRN